MASEKDIKRILDRALELRKGGLQNKPWNLAKVAAKELKVDVDNKELNRLQGLIKRELGELKIGGTEGEEKEGKEKETPGKLSRSAIDSQALEKAVTKLGEDLWVKMGKQFDGFSGEVDKHFAELKLQLSPTVAAGNPATAETGRSTLQATTQDFPVEVQMSEFRRTLFRAWHAKHQDYEGDLDAFLVDCFDYFFKLSGGQLRYVETSNVTPREAVAAQGGHAK